MLDPAGRPPGLVADSPRFYPGSGVNQPRIASKWARSSSSASPGRRSPEGR